MCRKNVKKRLCCGLSGVRVYVPAEISEGHPEAAKHLEEWAASRGGILVDGWNRHPTVYVGHGVEIFEALYGSQGQWGMPSAIKDSPQRAECIGDDDYFLREKDSNSCFSRTAGQQFYSSCFPDVNNANFPRKKFAHATLLEGCEWRNKDLINKLPDELLCEIFRFLPRARDRAVCASVSMRWLMLQSHMRREEFHSKCSGSQSIMGLPPNGEARDVQEGSEEGDDEVYSQETLLVAGLKGGNDDRRVERQPQWAIGDLSRCLEERKATDVRLCAIAVGTAACGGLGKLSIRRGSAVGFEKGVSDIGLSAVGFCCSALRNLSLWDCPNITDEGLAIIGKGCRLLEKVDLLKCSSVGNVGLQSIAKNCPLVSFLSLDECGLVGNRALTAIGEGCPNLLSLNIRNCPLIGDDGLVAIICNSKKLKKMKLEGLRIGDKSLAFIGHYCKALICLSLHNLDLVTEEGFRFFGNASGMQSLERFSVRSCNSFLDYVLSAMGSVCIGLKYISLVKCEKVSDIGLSAFMENALSLEILQLEACNLITWKGLTAAFSSTTGKLRKVQARKCDGIQDADVFSPVHFSTNSTVKSICLAHCRGVGDMCLSLVGCLCRHVTELDLTGLTGLSDEGLLAFLYSGSRELKSVNLSGCVNITDRAVCAIAEQCSGSLRNFVLDGCKMVTDKGLMAIAMHCAVLEELDVSQCKITDKGVTAVVLETGQTLSSLNLSGCGAITDKVLPLIEKQCQGLVGINLKHCHGLTRKVLDNFESCLWKCDVFCS